MHFVFLEKSIDFTSSSLNFKAIDSFQRALIHFSKELVKRNHKVTIYNNTSINKTENGIEWTHFTEISERLTNLDVLIVCNDINFLNNIEAKLNYFGFTNINTLIIKNTLIIY